MYVVQYCYILSTVTNDKGIKYIIKKARLFQDITSKQLANCPKLGIALQCDPAAVMSYLFVTESLI